MLNDTLPSTHITQRKTQISARDIPHILDMYADKIKILSLDCFDTLLWRKTSAPKDIFNLLAERPLAKSLGVTAYQRISAAARAYRTKFVTEGSRQIHLSDIYRGFTSLTSTEQDALVEEEIKTEIEMLFAFMPFVELIRQTHQRGLKVIIVSDIYLREAELRRLLSQHLPADVMTMIDAVYCSYDFGSSKSEGLFPLILEKMNIPAQSILHIGDHSGADFQSPQQAGLHALHFLQFDQKVVDFLRLQQTASALAVLAKTAPLSLLLPRFSPFRAIFSMAELHPYAPETLIGYMSFGPILYAYARFLTDEVEALRTQGKRVKVFFLLRDAYLLSRATEAYTRKPVGKLLRIRKFVAVAASFKTIADIDYYISGIKPEYYHFNVITEQLLLPAELAANIIQMANRAPDPQATFHQLIHQQNVMDVIFENSAAYRARLKRYMLKEMELEEGDTVVLADTGFIGVTQDYLTRTFQAELNIEILGRYVLASHEPDKPACKSLITTTWCDHSLFEQSCTFKEGAVVDYDENGDPLFENIRLSDDQYKKVSAIQSECIRFIHDAKTFFTRTGVTHDFSLLQAAAHAALQRHVYLPLEEELEYFKGFQHDKDMGYDRKKTVYNVKHAEEIIKKSHSPFRLNPYEARAASLDLALSNLLQRGLQLDMTAEDMSVRFSPVKIIVANNQDMTYKTQQARHMHDGYFSLMLPCVDDLGLALVFGEHYEWVQMDKIKLLNQISVVTDDMKDHLIFSDISNHDSMLQCQSRSSLVMIKPLSLQQTIPHYYHIVFRPLIVRQ
jgi:FMN phosphatase YigB (HAD superfamily)